MMSNYFLLDAAKAGAELFTAQRLNGRNRSLYKGRAEEDLATVAPYLFDISGNSAFMEWYFKTGWGKSWGVLLFADCSLELLYRHFRTFLIVRTDDNRSLYFRYYDPRVLTMFLPTCDSGQVKEFFGPVEYFIAEDQAKEEVIRYTHTAGDLLQKKIDTAQVFSQYGN
jgi:hypothetical protein